MAVYARGREKPKLAKVSARTDAGAVVKFMLSELAGRRAAAAQAAGPACPVLFRALLAAGLALSVPLRVRVATGLLPAPLLGEKQKRMFVTYLQVVPSGDAVGAARRVFGA